MAVNKVTGSYAKVGGLVLAGTQVGVGGQKVVQALQGTIARTDTADKNLFSLPANSTLLAILVDGAVASDAGTTAIVDVGVTGTDTQYVSGLSVKTPGGAELQFPQIANAGNVGTSAVQVVGKYVESGTLSTTGGPWTVTALFI